MNRRQAISSLSLWPVLARAQQHARHAAADPASYQFRSLTSQQVAILDFVCARLIPTDETPGAREAGVVYFIDHALETFARGARGIYREGLDDLRSKSFHEQTVEIQDLMLKAIENTPFFERVLTHTMYGMFGNPGYGGNRGKQGWTLIGFDDRHRFQPPFGYYDREQE